ncbi:MAG: hypothetical protein WD800_06745, partial [Dehalococcoidia bacterium]
MPGPRLNGRRPRLAAAVILAFALSAFAFGGTPAASQVADLGDENSWIRIQNVGTEAAAVELDFYDNAGNLVATDACPSSGNCDALPSGFGRTFFQQTLTSLPNGYRGSAYVTADQPFTALLSRDVLRTDGEFQIAGDALRLGPGASRHALPWVANNVRYASRIVVQNTSDAQGTCAQIQYYAQGSTSVSVVDPATPSSQCPNGGQYLAPRASWVRDEFSLPVPGGFDGSAVVVAQSASGGASAGSSQMQVSVDTPDRLDAGLAPYR